MGFINTTQRNIQYPQSINYAPANIAYTMPTPGSFIPAIADTFVSPSKINTNNQANNIATQYAYNNYVQNFAYNKSPQINASSGIKPDLCPWVTDPEIKLALNLLGEIEFSKEKLEQVKKLLGITKLPLESGAEALEIIKNNNIKVDFIDMGDSVAHAFYEHDTNTIGINKNYKGKMTMQMALGISLALLHEAGHAKDKDRLSSIQEELECLALNALGYEYFERKYPDVLKHMEQSRLISDGVALYPKLFFDLDPNHPGLRKRVKEKYGSLPISSPNHDGNNSNLKFATDIRSDFIFNNQVAYNNNANA